MQKWILGMAVVLLLLGATIAYASWQVVLLGQQNEKEQQLSEQLLNQNNQLSDLLTNLTIEVNGDQSLISNLIGQVNRDQSVISNLTGEVSMYQSLLFSNASSANATIGLSLRVGLNSSVVSSGEGINISVDELNLLDRFNNVSVSDAWALEGLATAACPSLFYPFGVAVFQGIYTGANVSQALPLRIFPVVACPMLVIYISGYLFQPMSDNATVLPGMGEVPMATMVSVSGTYNMTGTKLSQLTPFTPGTYTVVAGDEWGNLAFAYFVVVASS